MGLSINRMNLRDDTELPAQPTAAPQARLESPGQSAIEVQASELTLIAKVKREVVYDRYGPALDALYDDVAPNGAAA